MSKTAPTSLSSTPSAGSAAFVGGKPAEVLSPATIGSTTSSPITTLVTTAVGVAPLIVQAFQSNAAHKRETQVQLAQIELSKAQESTRVSEAVLRCAVDIATLNCRHAQRQLAQQQAHAEVMKRLEIVSGIVNAIPHLAHDPRLVASFIQLIANLSGSVSAQQESFAAA